LRRVRRHGKKDNAGSGMEWMTTYGDMVTLLLTFFILIYSMSVIDVVKFKAFITSFQGSGVLNWNTAPLNQTDPPDTRQPDNQSPRPDQTQVPPDIPADVNPLLEVFYTVQALLEETGLQEEVEVRYEDRGIALEIKDRVLFDSGKADLKQDALAILDVLAGFLDRLPYQISVEGHTDNRRIHTQEFPSNWELSAARAVRVVRYFTEVRRLDPVKFAAVGFSQYQPIVPNDTAENMAQNRRVVIMIIARDPYASEVLLSERGK